MKLRVSCKMESCRFELDWIDPPSIEFVMKYYVDYNKNHKDDMACVHEYHIETIEK